MAFWSSIGHMTALPAYVPNDLQVQQAKSDISENNHFISANKMRAATGSRESDQPASGGPNRRLACDPCRDRKVRCDRQHPVCGRCARLRHDCSYSSPSKQTAAKMDLSRLLLTLHSRLTQAEAQIAMGSAPALDVNPFDLTWPDADLATAMAVSAAESTMPELHPTSPGRQQPPFPMTRLSLPIEAPPDMNMSDVLMLESITDWSNQTPANANPNDIVNAAPETSTQASAPVTMSAFESLHQSHAPSPASSTPSEPRSQSSSAISASLVSNLHVKFFEVFDPILPIINQARFFAEIVQGSGSVAILALSYAVAALGALAAGDAEYTYAQEHCYNQARELLDVCERQETDGTLANINILQTCVLITLYEFKRPNFARSWMTLGRATRLCKMMGLDWIDDHGNGARPTGLHIHLAPASSPAELEERRRTFWVLYVFDAFAAIKSETATTFDATQMPVRIPCPGDLSSVTEISNMPSLPNIDQLSNVATLSPFAGTIITVSLFRRCFDHVRASLARNPSYSFWDAHYKLDRAILDGREKLTAQQSTAAQDLPDVLSLTLQSNLAAVEIWLHETALAKVEHERLPDALAAAAATRCEAAAYQVVDAIKRGQSLPNGRLDSFRQSSDFFIWPATTAIKSLRMLVNKGGPQAAAMHSDALRVLADTMRELVPPELLPTGLLQETEDDTYEDSHSDKGAGARSSF
ncbi:Depudecin biosynthesis cluster-specific transcription activator DEP6 [Paramyrothecium foliicola]|nr:Depudecin biosynthesis cluster-specific transcription activator DEP6 [Paramyrothecium foliicola]